MQQHGRFFNNLKRTLQGTVQTQSEQIIVHLELCAFLQGESIHVRRASRYGRWTGLRYEPAPDSS